MKCKEDYEREVSVIHRDTTATATRVVQHAVFATNMRLLINFYYLKVLYKPVSVVLYTSHSRELGKRDGLGRLQYSTVL